MSEKGRLLRIVCFYCTVIACLNVARVVGESTKDSGGDKTELVTLTITVDNNLTALYIDGVQLTVSGSASGNWERVQTFRIPARTKVIALSAEDDNITVAGVLASIRDGFVVTDDRQWKCIKADTGISSTDWMTIDYNDDSWHAASIVEGNPGDIHGRIDGISNRAKWIWTSRWRPPTDRRVYCRWRQAQHPQNATIRRADFRRHRLRCDASNYNPEQTIFWIKDGRTIDNGPPPEGFELDLYQVYRKQQLGYRHPVEMQGYYRRVICRDHSCRQNTTSNPALITFLDVVTLRGVIYNVPSWLVGTGGRDQLEQILRRVYPKSKGSVTGVADDISSSGTVRASIYFNVSVPSDIPAHSDFTTTWSTYINDMYYRDATRKLAMFSLFPSIKVFIRRTDACTDAAVPVEDGSGSSVSFPVTLLGATADSQQVCVFTGNPLAVGQCAGDFTTGATWEIQSTNTCNEIGAEETSQFTEQLKNLSTVVVDESNVDAVSSSLASLTQEYASLTSLDIAYTSAVVTSIAAVRHSDSEVSEKFLTTVNNIASIDSSVLSKAERRSKSTSRIVSAVDDFSSNLRLPDTSSSVTVTRSNVAVQVVDQPDDRDRWSYGFGMGEDFDNYYSLSSITGLMNTSVSAVWLSQGALERGWQLHDLLQSAFKSNGITDFEDSFRVSFAVYRNGHLFSSSNVSSDDGPVRVNSFVISGSINGVKISNLTEPIAIILRKTETVAVNDTCAYWDTDDVTGSKWSTEGVWSNATSNDSDTVICFSSHLTNFAVIAGFDKPRGTVIAKVLEVISIIGLSLSIVGLLLTIVSHIILFRSLRKSRSHMVLLHLSIALLVVDILVLAGINKTGNVAACKAVAALLLYFLLVSFSWMLVEAVLQYLNFVKVFNTYTSKFMLKAGLPAWIGPAIIVIIVACVDTKVELLHDSAKNYCWLAPNAFYFAFLLPLALIMVTNLIMFILIVKSLTCDSMPALQSAEKKHELTKLKVVALICCFVAMGLTWMFALFAIDRVALAMQVLFCIFNSLQGFLIFVFLNIRDKPVRDAWMKLFSTCRSRVRQVSGRVPIGHQPKAGANDDRAVFYSIGTSTNSESQTASTSAGDGRYADPASVI